jgi:ribosomal-protein-alanine N-acetyltransferase
MDDGASGEDLITLETPRLILRQWQPADLDRYAELFADPEVARYIFRGQPARREQLTEMSWDYLRQWRDLRLGPFAAVDRATGAWIGQIGLNHLAYWPGPEKTEVGWELHRRWWGRGLATEGGRAALRFGFEERGLRRIISTAVPDNHASRRVMEKLGLTYRGTHVIADAEIVWYAIDNAG